MSASGHHVAGSSVKIPVSQYQAAVTNSFPAPGRSRVVESSVAGRQTIDILPVNQTANQSLQDNYLEFRLPGVEGLFLDLSTLCLEVSLTLTQADGISPLGDDDHAVFVNGLGSSTLFKSAACYLNEQLVESNPLYGYWGFIKQTVSLNPNTLYTVARNSFYYRDWKGSRGIMQQYTEDYFTTAVKIEKRIIEGCKKNGLQLVAPLFLDIASLDQFMLDSVSLRMRLELASHEFVLNTHLKDKGYKYKINSARLFCDRVIPYTSALESVNKSLINESIDYAYKKTIYKS